MMKTLFLASAFAVFCCIPCFSQAGWTNFNTTNSPLLDDIVSAIAIDHDNNLWGAYAGAGGLGNGIVRFDGNQWTHFNSLNSGLPNDDIRAIAVDMHGNLWFANYNAGIVKFNGATWIRYNTSNSNIVGNDVVDIEFDANGNLWVGCYFSGISKFDGTTWTNYTKSNAPFPASNCISDLTIDKSNNVWVGMDCAGGMAKLSSASGTWTGYQTSNSNIPDHTVRSLQADNSGLIFASHINVNVSSFNGTTWTSYNGLGPIDSFTVDTTGDFWGCGYGLFKYEDAGWTRATIPAGADTIYSLDIAAGTADNLWLATYSGLWINKVNTPPAFSVSDVTLDEDFGLLKVQIAQGPVPQPENAQLVTYSLINLNDEKITASIDSHTGEITLTSVADAFGTALLRIIANDGQFINSIYADTLTVSIKEIAEVIPNTPPAFALNNITVDEDFGTLTVQVTPAPVPEAERGQIVTYSLINHNEEKVTATIDSQTGQITLLSILDAFGTTSIKIIANDGQPTNNVYEANVTITITEISEVPPNTPPAFAVDDIVVDENFGMLKVQVKPATVPEHEKVQSVTYSLTNLNDQLIKSTIDQQTGEITLTSIPDAFGSVSLKVVANDGQLANNIYIDTLSVIIKEVKEIVTGVGETEDDDVYFFPNPVLTYLMFKTGPSMVPTDILIKDMMGRQVMKSRVSAGSERIELSFLQSGCYIIMLVGDNKISRSFKFIKSDR